MSCAHCYKQEKVIRFVNGSWRVSYEDSEIQKDMVLRGSFYYGYGNPCASLGVVSEDNYLETVEECYHQHEYDMYVDKCEIEDIENPDGITWEDEYEVYLNSLARREPELHLCYDKHIITRRHDIWERKRKRKQPVKNRRVGSKFCCFGTYQPAEKRKGKLFSDEEFLIGFNYLDE